jgi:hypothetical protein
MLDDQLFLQPQFETDTEQCLLYYMLHVQLIPIDYYRLVWIGV